MLDRWALKLIKPSLTGIAKQLNKRNIHANQVTVTGFAIGMMALPALAMEQYGLALLLILLNRLSDGLDGALARLQQPTDVGAFLDIVLDFIFYSGVVFGFALANPSQNALAAAGLIFSFMGTGASFLAFAVLAEKRGINSLNYPNKGFYYIGGIAEGTETILVFVALCLWPQKFVVIAWSFAAICYLTTIIRVLSGYYTLRSSEQPTENYDA